MSAKVTKLKLSKFFHTTQYKKMLFMYSSFTVAVLLITAFIIIGNYNKSLAVETEKANRRLLAQVKISSDLLLEEKIYSIIYGKFADLSRDINVKNYFSGDSSYNVETLGKLYEYLSNVSANNAFIESIYLYRKSDDTIITSREGVMFSITEPGNYNRQFVNMDAITSMMSSEHNSYWVSPYENSSYWIHKPIISISQSIPLIPKNRKLGCIIINIDERLFFQSINHGAVPELGELLIMDSDGRIFSRSDYRYLLNPGKNDSYLKDMVKGQEGFLTSTISGKSMGISWIKSSVNDWWYISVVPIETMNRQILLVKQFSLLFLALIILFSLIFVNYITVRMYKPFKQLLNNISKRFNVANDIGNEAVIFNSVITKLSDRVEEVEQILKNNQGLIRHKIVSDILKGNVSGNDGEISERLEVVEKRLDHRCFSIIIVEVNEKSLTNLSAEQREYIKYKIVDMIDGFHSNSQTFISISIERNRTATIANFEDYYEVSKLLYKIIGQLNCELGISCNIAISDETESLIDLCSFYEATVNLLKYSFIYNYGNVFNSELVKIIDRNDNNFEIAVFDSLIPLLKAGKAAPVKDKIDDIFRSIKEGGFSYSYIQNILMQLIGILSRVIREQNVQNDMLDNKRILEDFNVIVSLNECRDWVNSIIETYMDSVSFRDSSIDEKFVPKIVEYICGNIEKDITLNNVAAEFYISPNYLSKLFKESTGINFSDFVLGKKLERAKELLLTERTIRVSDIGQRLGYNSTPYFIGIFKEKYGITPARMRKCNL